MPLPIFIITLKTARKRRQPLLEQLQEAGLEYTLWFGVDGRHKLPAEFEKHVDRNAAHKNIHREMIDTEFACALSHHLLYQEILKNNPSGAIVLEDDAIVGPRFAQWARATTDLHQDLLLLDHKGVFASKQNPKRILPDTQAFRITLPPYLSTGYAISNNGAAAFIKHGFPIRGLADWPFDISQLDAWAVMPKLVEHGDLQTSGSDIRQARDVAMGSGRAPNRNKRFFQRKYWRRKWKKTISIRIS